MLTTIIFAAWKTREGEDARRAILRHVKDNPGVHQSELARLCSCSISTVRYHLYRLHAEGRLHVQRVKGFVRVIPSTMDNRAIEFAAAAAYPETRRLIDEFGGEDFSIAQVARRLDWSRKKARIHLDRLRESGILESPDDGSRLLRFQTAAAAEISAISDPLDSAALSND